MSALDLTQPVPVVGKFGHDFVQQLVMLEVGDTIDEVAEKVAAHSVGRRLVPQDRPMAVYLDGYRLAPGTATVASLDIQPMSHVLVEYAEEAPE